MKISFTGRAEVGRSTKVWSPCPGRPDGRGVDLSRHYNDLRSVAIGSYSKRCVEAGVDVEDLISIVAERILRSNSRSSAFDPTKSSLPRYLHLLCASRLSYLADQSRVQARRHVAPSTEPGDESVDLFSSIEGAVSQDALEVVQKHLPQVAWEARVDDSLNADFPMAFCYATEGEELDPENRVWSGWREQAVLWAVADAEEGVRSASSFWCVSVQEAARRLEWGRAAWREYLSNHQQPDR